MWTIALLLPSEMSNKNDTIYCVSQLFLQIIDEEYNYSWTSTAECNKQRRSRLFRLRPVVRLYGCASFTSGWYEKGVVEVACVRRSWWEIVWIEVLEKIHTAEWQEKRQIAYLYSVLSSSMNNHKRCNTISSGLPLATAVTMATHSSIIARLHTVKWNTPVQDRCLQLTVMQWPWPERWCVLLAGLNAGCASHVYCQCKETEGWMTGAPKKGTMRIWEKEHHTFFCSFIRSLVLHTFW